MNVDFKEVWQFVVKQGFSRVDAASKVALELEQQDWDCLKKPAGAP